MLRYRFEPCKLQCTLGSTKADPVHGPEGNFRGHFFLLER